jgi:peptide/nickel transport system permease protein
MSRLSRMWDSDIAWSFRHSPVAMIATFVALTIILAAVLAPWIAPHDPFNPASLNLMDGFTPPMEPNPFTGNVYLLGTDNQGRDIFSTLLYGARISLFVGFSAVLFAMTLGITVGLLAAWRGGWIDSVLMRIADVQLTFPSILIALLIFGIARGLIPPAMREEVAIWVLIVAIGLADWVQFARVVRGAAMVEKSREYVQAARVIGVSPPAIMLRHVLPNVLGPVLVIATINVATAIITEATLSFLGVGVPPTTPSLGTMINNGNNFLYSGEWWLVVFPGTALVLLCMSVNLLGDWLRDALNPRLQ